MLKFALDAIDNGYAFVIQNERGKFFSEGEWEILGRPRTDGYDALTWLAEQPWSNGKVATLGCSSTAEWQMALAAMDHPAHAAAVPMGQGGRYRARRWLLRAGATYTAAAPSSCRWCPGCAACRTPSDRPCPTTSSREDRVRLAKYFDLGSQDAFCRLAKGLCPPADSGFP